MEKLETLLSEIMKDEIIAETKLDKPVDKHKTHKDTIRTVKTKYRKLGETYILWQYEMVDKHKNSETKGQCYQCPSPRPWGSRLDRCKI